MDNLLIAINAWIIGQGLLLAGLGCFLWGMVSVLFSPCHLASIPLLVSYVAGQNTHIAGRKAAWYALVFTIGLFIAITLTGLICALLGRMLGDVGPYMGIVVGLVLIWVGLNTLGLSVCTMPGTFMAKVQFKGMAGALFLGLTYGILSGSCTFGFIAPILAIITVQQKIITGVIFILLFGLGHCIPIALAGSSTALIKQFLENSAWQRSSTIFRKLAGLCIAALGVYFILEPFF